jgi:hypothetical protein
MNNKTIKKQNKTKKKKWSPSCTPLHQHQHHLAKVSSVCPGSISFPRLSRQVGSFSSSRKESESMTRPKSNPKLYLYPNPQVCEYVTLPGKRDFADVMSRILQ